MRRVTSVAVALVCLAASAPLAAQDDAQGFLRVVEGAATLIRVEDGQAEAARENTPVLSGDRLSLSLGARVEVILPDAHRLRLAESADLELTALARSLDEDRAGTALLLTTGALAIDVPRDAVDRTRVDTDIAGVLLEPGGLYLVEIDGRGDTRVVVRAGEAEILGQYDSTVVRAGDEAVVPRDGRERIALVAAPPLTDVEEWARQLEAEAARAEIRHVEPELRYAAQPLARYGTWVDGGAGYAWRPRVAVGWRPYYQGYWEPSPAGLVWASYEPWGWVPYHYGNWDLHPSYGWLWYPGRVYRPAHVVWYWGSSHAGWIPSGYYGSFYARRFGFHVSFGSGFYGVSHASWHAYRDWVFCPTRSIGHHHQYRYHGDHRAIAHRGGFRGADRAFITADTHGIGRRHWGDARAVEEVIGRRAHRRTGGGPAELPDVSAVVARSPEVSDRMLRDLDRGGGDGRGGDGGRVAVHRPSGPGAGGGEERASQSFDTDDGRPTRVAPRRPTVADEGVTRQVPVDGAPGAGAHRSPVARPRGERDQPAADAGVPIDRGGPRDRSVVRSRQSSGLEVEGITDRTAPAPSDRARVAQPRVDRGRPGLERAAPQSQVRAYRERPTVERSAPAPPPQTRTYRERPSVERSSPAPAPQVRALRERPTVDRAAPQPQVRAYRERPIMERAAPQPQASAYRERPTMERAAPQPQARAYRQHPTIEHAAPQPRARAERSYSSPAASSPPSVRRESRAPAQASAPARAPRAESSRPAPAVRESSRSAGGGGGGGGGHARAREGGQSRGGVGGGGRGHAGRPR